MTDSNSMIFCKCPKCGSDDGYVICDNCDKFDMFSLKNNLAECDCGEKIEETECDCGATIYGKHFFIDKEKEENSKKSSKQEHLNNNNDVKQIPKYGVLRRATKVLGNVSLFSGAIIAMFVGAFISKFIPYFGLGVSLMGMFVAVVSFVLLILSFFMPDTYSVQCPKCQKKYQLFCDNCDHERFKNNFYGVTCKNCDTALTSIKSPCCHVFIDVENSLC